MGLEIKPNQLPGVSVQPNFFVNTLQKYLASQKYVTPQLEPDTVSVNTDLYKYINSNAVSEMVQVNSEITRILNELKIPLKINMNVLHDLVKNHLPKTKNAAIGIANKLPKEFKSEVDFQALQKASVLHDYGKVLIPEKILNKEGKLTPQEREIMQKHSVLGYEMLKNTDLDQETLHLIRNHHQNAQKSGYPAADDNFVADINLQILSAADVYSALREKRSYKIEMTKNQALAIMHNDVKQGKMHPYVFKALVDYANEEENLVKVQPKRKLFNLKFVNSLSA